MSNYEIYHLLIRDKDYPGFLVCEKVEFETQKSTGSVEFNYRKVMEYEDDPNVEIVGFFHTHPDDCPYMSETDVATMKAWATCFGRPLLCVIGCFLNFRGSDDPSGGAMRKIREVETVGWWCWKKIAVPVDVAQLDPNRYFTGPSDSRYHSHIIVKKSHEDVAHF